MDLVLVGKIVNIFGLNDELKIVSFSHHSQSRYKKGNILILKNETTGQQINVTVSSYRHIKGLDIVRFEEISTNLAPVYFNWSVLAEKQALTLPEDTYFYDDLMGCQLIDELGQVIGTVKSVADHGAHPILKALNNDGVPFQIPFVPFFIINVNIDTKTIMINVIDGLL